jgi:release factor glutamine methyltransferase
LTVQAAQARGARLLASAGIGSPALDASLLLAEALGLERGRLILAYPDPLPDGAGRRFEEMLKRRLAGDSAAYILGRKEFWGLEFAVSPAVLVPRPDTETLVEAALEYVNREGGSPPLRAGRGPALPPQRGARPFPPEGPPQRPPAWDSVNDRHDGPGPRPYRLLDLCTGSGAAAVALKHEKPDLEIWATDISAEALEIARLNAARLLAGRLPAGNAPGGRPDSAAGITFIQSDLFARIPGRFNIITANPPYVRSAEIPRLPAEVRGEPRTALDGGPDGLCLIRRIIAGAPEHLGAGGVLLLEADPRQMEAVRGELEKHGFKGIQTYRDLSGAERVIGGYI